MQRDKTNKQQHNNKQTIMQASSEQTIMQASSEQTIMQANNEQKVVRANNVRPYKALSEYVSIENITSLDIPVIAEIEQRVFTDGWNENMLREHFQNTNSLQLKLTDNRGTIIGYLITSCVLDEVNIDIIAIDENYRGNGYATMLLAEFEKQISHTANVIMLEVREKNLPAIALYKKQGFEEVGKRKNYYSNPSANAILMNKLL